MRKFEWKKKNRQQSHMCGNKGYTLVELIVTFALLAIFMTAVVACLPKITKIYTNLQAINHQKTICNTVSNQIRNELQSTLGVEGADDALGVQNVNGKGYIALIDDSGQQIMIPTGGAVSTGGAILPASDLTGDTIEFVLRDGIIAQLDAKGFNGYTMRKKKLQVDYHDAKAISSGALLTRYYQTDGDYNKKLTVIDYKSGDYAVATEAGIVTEGLKNVAYAIEYPYAKPFYEGYELKTKFTIKRDAFYSYGDGTTESPKRTYVNYINYTLSLWKDGHMKYAQDYVVNVQNAVPYLGTKVAVDPVVPDVPVMSGTYVVPGSMHKLDNDPNRYQYYFTFHIEPSMGESGADKWVIHLPEGYHLKDAWYDDSQPHKNRYLKPVVNGNTITIERYFQYGFIEDTEIFKVLFETDGQTVEDLSMIDGSDNITCISTPLATSDNVSINKIEVTHWGDADPVIQCYLTPKEETAKVYLEATFEKPVISATFSSSPGNFVRWSGNTVRVYGDKLLPGTSEYQINLKVKLEGGETTDLPTLVKLGDEVIYPKP